ncbi:MAG: peptidoglycan DD-metalloendopeptidase family protein [Gammaproteobacteria bacterium]
MRAFLKSFIITLLLGIYTGSMAADDSKLLDLQNQIVQLQKKLSQTSGKQTTLHQQLSETKQRLEQAVAELQKTQLQLSRQQHLYQKFNQQQMIHQQQLRTHQALLTKQLPAIYKLLMADQFNPNDRLLNYCHYLQQGHLYHIQKLQQSLQQITQNTKQIGQKTQLLQRLQHKEQQTHQALEVSRLQHQQALQSLSAEIEQQHQKLQRLVANKQNLQGVIIRLQLSPSMSLLSFLKHPDFASQQGKLAWPTSGVIIEHFGAPIAESELKWTDILIQAPEGQKIQAVADGKVVFANAMAGYGLLLIIDHGNGYMTLYGHNQNLYKKVGDIIKTGELIATVGHAENDPTTALYFGIRHNGKPLNPERWCG